MSRSSGSGLPAQGQQAQARRLPEADPRTQDPRTLDPRTHDPRTGQPYQQPAYPPQAYDGYTYPNGQPSPLTAPPAVAPHPGPYRQPVQAYDHSQPYVPAPAVEPRLDPVPPTRPPHAYAQPSPYAQQPSYAPQFETGYQAQPQPAAYAPPADLRYAPPAQRPPVFDGQQSVLEPVAELRGAQYDQWPAQQQPASGYPAHGYAQQPQHPADARGYDLGTYMPAAQPADPRYDDQQWQVAQAQPVHGNDPRMMAPVPADENAVQAYDDELEYEDEPRSGAGRRGLMIVGALVGAIGLGVGLAYAYKSFGPQKGTSAPKVVSAPSGPAKIQPADPGGKKLPNADSKLMDRLPTDGQGGRTPDPVEGEAGARKVQIIPVGRDGSLGAPQPAPVQAIPSVPGMTIVSSGVVPVAPLPGGQQQAQSQQQAAVAPVSRQPPAQAQPQAQHPGVRPQVVSRVEAAPEPAAPTKKQQVAAATPPAAATAPAKKPQVRDDAAAASAPAAAAAAPRGGGSGGFVAVLASQRSRVEALKSFADLQQKYSDVLSNKIPDVLEADLSARGLGTMYRVVVGPPGSREAAADVCGKLKTAGYNGCWVTAY